MESLVGYGPNLGMDLKSADDPRERNATSSPLVLNKEVRATIARTRGPRTLN
jgi:hypothetical protein